MATKSKKGNPKDLGEKKSAKRSEENTPVEEKREESPKSGTEVETHAEDVAEVESAAPEEPSPAPPTPEPVYEEPVLTQLIVESYEGEKEKGLYEGQGDARFTMGHGYKGQFMEGLMHGKGEYTWADGLNYQGDFTMNKVTGKGIYKWPDGSSYDGDVVDGLRHGFGTFVTKDEKMRYTGEWVKGKRTGKGRMDYDPEGMSFYEGDWLENIRHGWGTRCYPSGNVYQGLWYQDIRHGEGTMRWLDTDQMYTGQWEKGVQHGLGQHIWFLKRVGSSQYPMRNMYDGEFFNGMREGTGTFYYANGARYEGEWKNNMKHGKGKFIFKNGRVYEGVFDKDHIMEFPDFTIDGNTTPDLTQIRTRTPLPSEGMTVRSNDSHNTHSPSFQLEVDHLLREFPDSDRDYEAAQVIYVIMRYMTELRKIYNFYSGIGYDESPDNTYIMTRLQFWRMLKDCRLHVDASTLTEMDRVLFKSKMPPNTDAKDEEDIHSPYTKILFREYINDLVILAHHLYADQFIENHSDSAGSDPMLAWCMSQLINQKILRFACTVEGFVFFERRRAINALIHLDQAYDVYKMFCSTRKYQPHEPIMKMREFLFMMKDLKLLNADLTTKHIIDILAKDDPGVADREGSINLELEMTFLEFLEALVGCAEIYVTEAVVKDPSTPRASTTLTQEQSMMSMPGSPSRAISQEDGAEEESLVGSTSSREGAVSAGRASAASQVTNSKLGSAKPSHQQSQGIELNSTHTLSAKKSEIDQKKSGSFISTRSGPSDGNQIVNSMMSMGEYEDDPEEEEEEEEDYEEELDEATRQFNFWTHQVHIFFVRKFFPAAHRLMVLKQLVRDKYPPPVKQPSRTGTCSPERTTTAAGGDATPKPVAEVGSDGSKLQTDDDNMQPSEPAIVEAVA